MRKLILSALIVASAFTTATAQLAMTRSVFNGAYTPIVGGTTSTATGDDAYQQNLPVGFSFSYLGTPYTQFSVSTNGWLSFANVASFDAFSPDLYSVTTSGVVAPWWDDLTTSSIVYQTTGTVGSQVCTIQWTSLSYYFTSTRTINYQVKLYEGTNVIEFWYGAAPTGTINTAESASIGIKSIAGGNGQYIDAVTGSSFTGCSSIQSDRWPSYNFRFTPGAPTALAGGTYNVGVGQTYRNLNEAAADVNHRGVSGAINFNLVDAQYDVTVANGSNFFPILVGPVAGSSAANTITFSKIGTAAIIAYGGASGTNGAIANQANITALASNVEPIIGLVGADYVTINNLDIRGNVGNLLSDHGVGVYNSSATDGATNNTISNVTVTMVRANTGSRGFVQNVITVPTSAAGANSNNTFKDFTITSVYAGVQLLGNATFPDINTQVTRTNCATYNTIGNPATLNDIGNGTAQTYGILATNQSGFTISNNSIRNVSGSAVQTDGIVINTFQGTCTVSNNKIQTIRNFSTSSTTGIAGIRMSHATTGTHTIRVFNNTVSEITSAYTGVATAARTLKGIFVNGAGGTTAQTYEIYNNAVSIDGSTSLNLSSSCLEVNNAAGPVYLIGNNILANFTATQAGVARHYVFSTPTALTFGPVGTVSNNNDVFIANDAGVSGYTGFDGTTPYNTLANWTAAITPAGLETASLAINPLYVNNLSDLHPGALALNAAGQIPPVYITVDQFCAPRVPDNDLGAYIINACSGTPTAGTITGASSVCSGSGTTLTLTGASSGAGITYQWASATTNGGPYTTLLGTSNTQATGPVTVPTYYVVGVGCTVSGLAAVTLQYTLLVNPLPAVAVTPTSGSICLPAGSPVALTASNASTYTWLPAAGLSSTTISNPTANPAATTTYTVTGTDGNGCVNTATTTITVGEAPSLSTVTATPPSVCSGGNAQLLTSAATTTAYAVTSIPYALTPTPGVGVTTLANAGVAVTPLSAGTLDDGGWQNQVIPFNFMYFGTAYTSFAVSTNGFVRLGAGAPNTFTGYNNAFPSAAAARPSIGAIYSDLDFRTVGTINYFVSGTAPFRTLVINWSGGNFYNAVGSLNTQMVIYETTNIIEVHTTSSTGTNTAVQGIQNAAGTTAVVAPGRNSVNWTVTVPDAYRWSPSGGPVTYAWSPATFLSSTTINNPMANAVTATTTYTVTATAGTCTSTGTATISLPTALTSTASVAPGNTVCAGTNVTFTATPTGGLPIYTYAWTGPNGFTASTANPTLNSITTAGNGTYTCTITDNCTTTTTDTVTVTVNALPVVALSGNSSFCFGDSTLLTGSSGGTSQWYLNGVAIVGATNNTYMATVAGVYNMIKTNLNGCLDSSATGLIVVINALPTVVASASATTVCSGDSITFTGAGATTYTWSATVIDAVPFSTTLGGYYVVTGTDANSCVNMDSVMITVNALPVVALGADVVQCAGSVTLDAGNVGATYMWNDSTTAQTLATSTSGTYYVDVIDANTCSSSDTVVVTINPLPVVTLGADTTSCGSIVLDAGNAGSTYMWNDSTTAQTLTTSTSGTYYVDVIDANTCASSDTVVVTINPLPVVALGADTTSCGSIVLDAGNAGSTYMWNDSTTAQTLTAGTSGQYTVEVMDANGCMASDTVNVTVNTPPVVALGLASDTACLNGGMVTLTGGTPAGGVYSGTAVSGGMFDPLTAGLGTYAITYTYTDSLNGCISSAVDSVLVDVCSGTSTPVASGAINIYPNPNLGQFMIDASSLGNTQLQVVIYNSLGQIVDGFVMNGTHEVNLTELEGGIYMIRITNGDNTTIHRVVKQ